MESPTKEGKKGGSDDAVVPSSPTRAARKSAGAENNKTNGFRYAAAGEMVDAATYNKAVDEITRLTEQAEKNERRNKLTLEMVLDLKKVNANMEGQLRKSSDAHDQFRQTETNLRARLTAATAASTAVSDGSSIALASGAPAESAPNEEDGDGTKKRGGSRTKNGTAVLRNLYVPSDMDHTPPQVPTSTLVRPIRAHS